MRHNPFPASRPPLTLSRRRFVQASAAFAAAGLAPGLTPALARSANAGGSATIRVGVIGCGGRGTGAAVNILEASPATQIVALADVFPERVQSCRKELGAQETPLADRARVSEDRCHTGFDAYKQLLAGDVDLVILATPPHFRPIHLAEAVARGKHVFMEKPVAVDPAGIRSVLASAAIADQKKLGIVAGTQRRHEDCYLQTMKRIQDGAIGQVVSGRVYWNQGGLWMHPRQPAWSDMEWQLRNWLYYTWLSGDHICEQHVHNLDVANWVVGAHPVRAIGMGGRQVRTGPEYGNAFDHFAINYEYPGGVHITSQCRQIDQCQTIVEEQFSGTQGAVVTSSGRAEITGKSAWKHGGEGANPYVQEHTDLIDSIQAGKPLNEARAVAEATLTAIMGRMSAYTGQTVTWEQALNSELNLAPKGYAFGPLPFDEVPVPGRTKLI
jgi:predicted dehydrogenase